MLHYAGVCTDGKEKVQEVAWGNAKVLFFLKKTELPQMQCHHVLGCFVCHALTACFF